MFSSSLQSSYSKGLGNQLGVLVEREVRMKTTARFHIQITERKTGIRLVSSLESIHWMMKSVWRAK